jgi:hypothetical protein
VEALQDRVYGRPKQAVDVNTGIDLSALEPGQRAELRRVLTEQLRVEVERAEPGEA